MSTVVPDSRSFGELMATRSARIGVVGLGYAGLPLGMSFAEAGFTVTGIDLSEERVARFARRAVISRLNRWPGTGLPPAGGGGGRGDR